MKKSFCILTAVYVLFFCFVGCSKADTHHQNSADSEISVTNNTENTSTSGNDNILLSVLYNEEPFYTEKGKTVHINDYKPIYKNTEDIDYIQKDVVFVPRDYAFVDLDHDGNNELIVAEEPYADTYLILHKENEKIYGYSLYNRWFQSLKQDGSFISSGGAQINDYNTITFDKNTYNISTVAKFYFDADNKNSDFEIDGKSVSLEDIKQFAEEWSKRPEAEWIEFKQNK